MIDDLIVYRGEVDVFIVPNAGNNARVIGLLEAAAPPGITVLDRHRAIATIAVQGRRGRG